MEDSKSSSGIRPPSKIGRPCCTLPPKPAVPSTPQKASMKHSMETLWETHSHRLREAGLRRGSDNSVVLTEDTDSFIIGDRVWVGGTKPGSIAYIGETQFAPGDWAGVCLDEPIGKNNGSVAGTHYFQCEPKHGIFSRLTRLTRHPLTGYYASSPPESIRSSLNKSVSPSLNASTTSLASTIHKDLRIGERVIVSSSQGSKTGVLRYLGPTEFANGEWCGVELDDAVGKNDGSVEGQSYFVCRPKHGLFAPVHKVSRSPSNRMGGSSCVVHKPSGASLNASFRSKANSRESLVSVTSIASTTASTATRANARKLGLRTSTPARPGTQESLSEKQREIEILRKERDAERERVIKAANQADQAEQNAAVIKDNYAKYREEMEKSIKETTDALTSLLEEKKLLETQLEEEKRKCEDLLFRFEEESINKDDIEVINTKNESKLKELENQLQEERERAAKLEKESTRLFELEEELAKERSNFSALSANEKSESQVWQERVKNLEESRVKLEQKLRESEEASAKHVESLRELAKRFDESNGANASLKSANAKLESDLSSALGNLREATETFERSKRDSIADFEANSENLKKEIERLKGVIEEMMRNGVQEKESIVSEYKKILEEKERIIQSKSEELKVESAKNLETQKSTLEKIQSDNLKRIEELSCNFNEQLGARDSKIQEITAQLKNKTEELERLLKELTNSQNLAKSSEDLVKSNLSKIEELSTKLKLEEQKNEILAKDSEGGLELLQEQLSKLSSEKKTVEEEVTTLKNAATEATESLGKLREELEAKDRELREICTRRDAELEEMRKRHEQQIDERGKCIQEMKTDMSQNSVRIHKLEKEIAELKAIIATKDEEIKNLVDKTSEMRDTVTLSEQTKTNLESELKMYETNIANLNGKLSRAEEKIAQITEQKDLEIKNLISSSSDSSEQLIKFNEELRKREKTIEDLQERDFQSKQQLALQEDKLKVSTSELEKSKETIKDLTLNVDSSKKLLEKEQNLHKDVSEKFAQSKLDSERLLEESKRELSDKVLKLEELSREVDSTKNLLKEAQDKLVSLAKERDVEVGNSKSGFKNLEDQLKLASEEKESLRDQLSKLEINRDTKEAALKELREQLDCKVNESAELKTSMLEKESKIHEFEGKLSELQRDKQTLEANLSQTNDKYNQAITRVTILESSSASSASEATIKLTSLGEQLARVESSNRELTDSLESADKTIDELKLQLGQLSGTFKTEENKSKELEVTLAESKRKIEDLGKTVESLRDAEKKLGEQVSAGNESIVKKERDFSALSNEKLMLDGKVKSLELELKSNQDQLEFKSGTIKSLEEKIQGLGTNEAESLKKLRGDFESQLEAKEQELEAIAKRNKELEGKSNSLEKTQSDRSKELEAKDCVIVDLRKNIESLTSLSNENSRKTDELAKELSLSKKQLEDLVKEKDNLLGIKNSLEKIAKERENTIETLTVSLKGKEIELESNLQLVQKLQESQKQLESTRNESVKAEAKLNNKNEPFNHNTPLGGGDAKSVGGQDIAKIMEENETAKSHIDFLNSVIADMQRKNDVLQCKVEVLEIGIPASEADDYSRGTLDRRSVAPRMFCDICDQFDLHDTEDCPRQGQDSPEPVRPDKTSKKPPVERPYCDNCEMFGHDTANCDENETF